MLKLQDVKRTVRSRSDGERYFHPKLLDGVAHLGQLTLALGYFQSRLGRTRHELEPETLVRFFGEPKIARGVVSCLGTNYRWRNQDFADVLDPTTHAWLADRGLLTPIELRLHLYDLVNLQGNGFLAAERNDTLRPLARRLHLSPAKLDQLIALDAEENAVLLRVGGAPRPEELLARYNFSVIDAILRSSRQLVLERVDEAAYASLISACELYSIRIVREQGVAVLFNQPDASGSYARWGARLTRALYTAAATHPGILTHGKALVHLPANKSAWYLFERATLRAASAMTGIIRRASDISGFQDAWARLRVTQGTQGWRLLSAPEPHLSTEGLLIAPYACRRYEQEVLLWPVFNAAALQEACTLDQAGVSILALIDDVLIGTAPEGLPVASLSDEMPGIVAALNQYWGQPRPSALEQALGSLLEEVDLRGFLPEAQVQDALDSVTPEELVSRLRNIDPARGAYVPGLGLCSPTFAETMRKGLRRKPRRTPAA